MSKRLVNEKEIEKNRLEKKWETVIKLVSAFNVKNVGGALSSEEVELFSCFYLGEAELEKLVENKLESCNFINLMISKDDLKQAYSYLSAAITTSRKSKDKYYRLLQDSTFLLAKYHYVVGEYSTCVDLVDSLNVPSVDSMSKRSRYIFSEVLTCKALSLEHFNKGSELDKDIILSFERAGEAALSIYVEEERSNLKRNTTQVTQSLLQLSKIMEVALLRPGQLLVENGLVEDAIHNYRSILQIMETKATYNLRKTVCRCLAQVLLSCVCSMRYTPPSLSSDSITRSGSVSIIMSTPRKDSPENLTGGSTVKPSKSLYSLTDSVFSPKDEIEESLLILLLAEAMHLRSNDVTQTQSTESKKRMVLNEANVLYKLLVLVLTRRDQYGLLANCLEKSMKLAYEEFGLWFNFGLSLVCARKYSRALLTFQQCHKLQPENTDVLMFSIKLCINHLQEYKMAIEYGNKVLDTTSDSYIKAGARCAIGVCYNQLSINAKSFLESQCLLKSAAGMLEKARELDRNDSEILFNLAWNQAMSKQLLKATVTLKESLWSNPSDVNTIHLLALVLSAQKKFKEALEVLETAIFENPTDFSLLLTKIKLTEAYNGDQAALVVCHYTLIQWNKIYNEKQLSLECDNTQEEPIKSPSFSTTRQSINESKILDATANLRKVTLADSGSIDDDGTGSIAASVRLEQALSEAPSGTLGSAYHLEIPRSIALLAKLWLVTAECFIHLNNATEAGGCILEAASIFPLSPDVLYMRGRLNELQGNVAEAKACYESCLAVYPDHKSSRQRVGLLYHDEGNFALAEKVLRGCILLDVSNHTAWNDLGLVLESCGRCEEASECFLTSLQLESTAPIASYSSIPRGFKAYDT